MLCERSGQVRQAVISASNASEGFVTLGDLDAALEWSERALSAARASGWPALIAVCQRQTGDVLRLLDRPEQAAELLSLAVAAMQTLGASRNKGEVLHSQGRLELENECFDAALATFEQMERDAQQCNHPDLLIKARRGQAGALSGLGDAERAAMRALESLAAGANAGQCRRPDPHAAGPGRDPPAPCLARPGRHAARPPRRCTTCSRRTSSRNRSATTARRSICCVGSPPPAPTAATTLRPTATSSPPRKRATRRRSRTARTAPWPSRSGAPSSRPAPTPSGTASSPRGCRPRPTRWRSSAGSDARSPRAWTSRRSAGSCTGTWPS